MAAENDGSKKSKKIVKYDNVGEPIYEEDERIKGIEKSFDPLTATLLIFGLIAFNFFVVANL